MKQFKGKNRWLARRFAKTKYKLQDTLHVLGIEARASKEDEDDEQEIHEALGEDLDASQERSPSTVLNLNDDAVSTPRRLRMRMHADSPGM